jgi:hypothetical protein
MLCCSMQFFQAHKQIVFKEKKNEQQKDFMVILMALCMTEEKI